MAHNGTDKLLHFTALPWGCETYDCISLVNRGLSTIPVRLVISSVRTRMLVSSSHYSITVFSL